MGGVSTKEHRYECHMIIVFVHGQLQFSLSLSLSLQLYMSATATELAAVRQHNLASLASTGHYIGVSSVSKSVREKYIGVSGSHSDSFVNCQDSCTGDNY